MKDITCIVCGNQQKIRHKLKFYVYKCPTCHLQTSDASFDLSFKSSLREDNREAGLKKLRFANFELIQKKLIQILNNRKKQIVGLEIGSGNGWWLKVCQENQIDCIGIEPEDSFRKYYQENNLNVVAGFYPNEATKSLDGYDFIIFNDVFEHISDLDSLILNLKKDIKPNGILIINLPISTGFFYKIAEFLGIFGIKSFLNRLWQFDFHSPHINYFNDDNLTNLLKKYNFKLLDSMRLESLDFSSIKERIMADKKNSRLKASIFSLGIQLLKPFILNSKPDIKVFYFCQNP
ncbi:MAG: class I SAM-dependent methyltransferase [Spirosomaceae bacterium]|jgi:2-polyprenyl-3-methyl-5-hydroxy-6-metoxy-1,4-benzoquinol methylase|nr:class I SAM-dependent methyltransferase [Spirosomataceae bacterium]